MSELHAKEYEIYEGKSLVAQTYGGPLYQHCNDKSYGEAVMLAKKMAACEDMYRFIKNLIGPYGMEDFSIEDAQEILAKADGSDNQ